MVAEEDGGGEDTQTQNVIRESQHSGIPAYFEPEYCLNIKIMRIFFSFCLLFRGQN